MVPDLLHVPFAIGLVLLHKAERVQCEESGILLIAVGHALVHPFDTGLHVLKYGLVLRAVENFAPDALDRGADKLSLGVIIVVDRADRDPACRGDRTDADCRPALFPDKHYNFTPNFVKEAGAKGYETQTGSVKVWSPYPDDPIFQKYYEKFIRALAKDFNDPDKVQFVSGSGFGKWGEYHSVWYYQVRELGKPELPTREAVFDWVTECA